MILRPYQSAAVAAVEKLWAETGQRVCLTSPTGSGKTEMAKALLAKARSPLALCHTRVLLQQTVRRVPRARVMTIQSLLNEGPGGDKRRASLGRYDMCFIDECHVVGAKDWRAVVDLVSAMRVFGATATPMRSDGSPLGDVFQHMVVAANYSDLLRSGHLCPCDVQRTELARKTQKTRKIRPDAVAAYLEHGRCEPSDPRYAAGLRWRPGLYFDGTVPQCSIATQRFRDAGLRAELVTFKTPDRERQALFRRYDAGELDMLASPMALSIGFDAPRAEVCVLRRMAESVGTYLQIVGRVLRPYPGKRRALLIDCSGASEPGTHGLPTSNRIYSLEGKGIQLADEQPGELDGDDEEAPAPVERVPYEDVQVRYQLVRDTLLARYEDLTAEAEREGYKSGWLWHQFRTATGLDVPRRLSLPVDSGCSGCGAIMPRGHEAFWPAARTYYHAPCWFRSLDGAELETQRPAADGSGRAVDSSYDWVDELR